MNTTIIEKTKTRDELKKIGFKGQTYDKLINELIRLRINSQNPLDSRFASLRSSESSTA